MKIEELLNGLNSGKSSQELLWVFGLLSTHLKSMLLMVFLLYLGQLTHGTPGKFLNNSKMDLVGDLKE